MAILPVSSVNLETKNRIHFNGDKEVSPREPYGRVDGDMEVSPREPYGRVDGDMEVSPRHNRISRGAKYASIPAVVMMTLSPALVTKAAELYPQDPKQITMEMPYAPTETEAEPMYALYAAPADKELPRAKRTQLDSDFESQLPLSEAKPLLIQKFNSAGHSYTIVYASGNFWGDNSIENVYIFEKGEPLLELKEVDAIVDHDIGPNEEYCGALVTRGVYDEQKKRCGVMEKEIRLPDEIAQNLVDLLTNDLKWENHTNIDFIQTDSKQLLPTKMRTSQ